MQSESIDLFKFFVDYGTLGIMVAVLLYAVKKMGYYFLNASQTKDTLDKNLNSLRELLSTNTNNVSMVLEEYRGLLKAERERSAECSEKFMAYLSTLDKEFSTRHQERLDYIKSFKSDLEALKTNQKVPTDAKQQQQ